MSGDEEGGIKLWDSRLTGRYSSCVMAWEGEHTDYISSLAHSHDGTTLLASSADCTLSAIDLRKATQVQKKKESMRRSDDQEDELLSLAVLKHGKKVVCGTQQGVLNVWSWGTWGDISDRFPGHPASIDSMLKVDEDTVLTGSADGVIRLVQIHPDKLVGVLGEHDGYPVETMAFNSKRSVLGSVSHDNLIRLWDSSILLEDNDDDEDEDDDDNDGDGIDGSHQNKMNGKSHGQKVERNRIANTNDRKVVGWTSTSTGKPKHGSDDEWEDESDSYDSVDSDDDKDSDDSEEEEEEETVNQKRAKRFKTDNERFFEDL